MLSLRLKTIASLIDNGKNVIDVGCDHGLLDIYLTLNNNNKCIAADVNKNAIKAAIKNIEKYNLSKKIEIITTNGLKNIEIKDNTTVVIAGMGTSNILEIVSEYQLEELIVSSHNDYYKLRKNLSLKYTIIEEIAVFDSNKYYLIVKLKKGKAKYSKKELMLGPILKNKYDITTEDYFLNVLIKNKEILKKIPKKYVMKRLKIVIENNWIKKR